MNFATLYISDDHMLHFHLSMLLNKTPLLIKTFSTSTTSSTWRTKIRQNQLATQVSNILLQRHNWSAHLQSFNISSNLTPSLFLQILYKTQHNPQISLSFFNWTAHNSTFQPDLKSHCFILQTCLKSKLSQQQTKPILETLVKNHSAKDIVDCVIQNSKKLQSLSLNDVPECYADIGCHKNLQSLSLNSVAECHSDKGCHKNLQSIALNTVLECYADKRCYKEGLLVFNRMRALGYTASVSACNGLLDGLYHENEVELAWCFYGAVVRNGVLPDKLMWSLVGKILCRRGKVDRLERLLDVGVFSSVIYNLVIEFYSKKGEFEAAFRRLDEMCERKFEPGFGSYGSVLDGACRYGNNEVIERAMKMMVEKGMLGEVPVSEYDSVIQRLCNLQKTYAAEMFYNRACYEKRLLDDATYGCMLRAFSHEGRLEEAVKMCTVILEKQIQVNDKSYYAFANVLCREVPSKEVSRLLREVIARGFNPDASELSKYMTSLCNKRRWQEAEQLLRQVLETGSLPDTRCCCALMKHYCQKRQIEVAIALHDKMEKLNYSLDTTSYNALLSALFAAGKIDEAIRVFDYIRKQELMDSSSFVAMIQGLCHVKELRKAMKLHDEMLKMGLKPDKKTYKRLISGFT